MCNADGKTNNLDTIGLQIDSPVVNTINKSFKRQNIILTNFH